MDWIWGYARRLINNWEPCKDEGYLIPFARNIPEKQDWVEVQAEAGMQSSHRNYKSMPIVEYVRDNYAEEKVLWFGMDKDLDPSYGINYSGSLDFISALKMIAKCKYFVGFNSILLYCFPWHKSKSFLFTDHQGSHDLRMHIEWKNYVFYDLEHEKIR